MRLAIDSFRGEAPRVTPRALPDNAAQAAVNARLLTGDLEAWKQFAEEKELTAEPGAVQTIYKLNGAWMSWASDVDVARGAVAGDTTFRTFLTGPDVYPEPRFTTYDLATTGSEPYPVTTKPLGVPAPESEPTLSLGLDTTATTFSVDQIDEGDDLDSAVTSPPMSGFADAAVTEDATLGNPAPSYKFVYGDNRNDGEFLYLKRNFGTAEASVIQAGCDFALGGGSWTTAYLNVANTQEGVNGIAVGYQRGYLSIYKTRGWGNEINRGALLDRVTVSVPTTDVWHRLEAAVTTNSDGTRTVRASLWLGSGELANVTATGNFDVGDWCGVSSGDPADAPNTTWFDNIHIQASGSTNYTPTNVATAYLYVFKNDLGQRSAPSPVSSTVLRPDGVSVTVTTPVDVPSGISADYQITTKEVFRAVTGSTGTVFRFVAEVALATAAYTDTLTDAQLGEVLDSDDWDLPPTDLQGILALPNGVMAGFSKNQLCLSAQNHPHAWPVAYRLTVDTDIVAIGNIDTTVVIGTENFIYLATGNDPAAYSMTKLEVPQACVSKRSLAYLVGIGVVFASPDGLIAVSGNGQVRNLTSSVFTRDQWQALTPTSIRAVAHDDIYFMFATGGSYALDAKPDGFGLIELGFHATAMFADPLTDRLYLVLDDNDEPSSPYLPLASTAPVPDGRTIYEFNAATGSGHMVYRWKGKLNLLPHPAAFCYCRVKAAAYDNLMVRLYGDGDLVFEQVVTSSEPFTLPMLDEYDSAEIEFLGTSRVRTVQFAESIEEIV